MGGGGVLYGKGFGLSDRTARGRRLFQVFITPVQAPSPTLLPQLLFFFPLSRLPNFHLPSPPPTPHTALKTTPTPKPHITTSSTPHQHTHSHSHTLYPSPPQPIPFLPPNPPTQNLWNLEPTLEHHGTCQGPPWGGVGRGGVGWGEVTWEDGGENERDAGV